MSFQIIFQWFTSHSSMIWMPVPSWAFEALDLLQHLNLRSVWEHLQCPVLGTSLDMHAGGRPCLRCAHTSELFSEEAAAEERRRRPEGQIRRGRLFVCSRRSSHFLFPFTLRCLLSYSPQRGGILKKVPRGAYLTKFIWRRINCHNADRVVKAAFDSQTSATIRTAQKEDKPL